MSIVLGVGVGFGAAMTEAVAAQNCNPAIALTTPDFDFEMRIDGTATHKPTGLTWKRCLEGMGWDGASCTGAATTYSWQQALQRAATMNANGGFAGQTNWRLPNIKELQSIVEQRCNDPARNMTAFPFDSEFQVWSASPYSGNALGAGGNAWLVLPHIGMVYYGAKYGEHSVHLVRGGQ